MLSGIFSRILAVVSCSSWLRFYFSALMYSAGMFWNDRQKAQMNPLVGSIRSGLMQA